MRLLGKYPFETLRDCLQGIFNFNSFYDRDNTLYFELELWQLRILICPNKYVELLLNQGNDRSFKSLGKIKLE